MKQKTLGHQETLDWISRHHAWRRARKTRPIWARPVEADEVGKAFQTADGAVEHARASAWLCVGVAGEPWFQAPENVLAKYDLGGTVTRRFSFDDREHRYQVYNPRPDARVWAARVSGPDIAGFSVHPGYDRTATLHSPAGGYVVTADVPDPYPAPTADVWLVQRGLFESTYEFMPH